MPRHILFFPALVVLAVACADSPTSRSIAPSTEASLASGSGSSGSSGRVQELKLRDDCDPATFNAVLGPGSCVGNGGTTFDEFNAELAVKRFVGAWKNNPDQFGDKAGTRIEVVNIGGEAHTFTRVANFGGGIVPPLNAASGNPVVAPECADLNPATIVPAGGHLHGTPLTVGTHKFQCCIHPWMRTTATIKAN